MQNVDVILFDLGGVLVELISLPSLKRMAADDRDEAALWRDWLHSRTVREFESGRMGVDDFLSIHGPG